MPDPAIAALATDPAAKVLVFVDGQNLYKRCRSHHWDWGHPGQRLPEPGPGVPPQQVLLTPWMRPQERGTGLDVVEFLVTRACDVAIIVSLDREIPQVIQNLSRLIAGRSAWKPRSRARRPETAQDPSQVLLRPPDHAARVRADPG